LPDAPRSFGWSSWMTQYRYSHWKNFPGENFFSLQLKIILVRHSQVFRVVFMDELMSHRTWTDMSGEILSSFLSQRSQFVTLMSRSNTCLSNSECASTWPSVSFRSSHTTEVWPRCTVSYVCPSWHTTAVCHPCILSSL
jgi:hypothetical protein